MYENGFNQPYNPYLNYLQQGMQMLNAQGRASQDGVIKVSGLEGARAYAVTELSYGGYGHAQQRRAAG